MRLRLEPISTTLNHCNAPPYAVFSMARCVIVNERQAHRLLPLANTAPVREWPNIDFKVSLRYSAT